MRRGNDESFSAPVEGMAVTSITIHHLQFVETSPLTVLRCLFYFCSHLHSNEAIRAIALGAYQVRMNWIIPTKSRLHTGRLFIASGLVMLLLLVATNLASAKDLVLNYAIDVDGKTDTGKLTNCRYNHVCEIRTVGLIVKIVVRPRTIGLPTMEMNVQGPFGCCHTAGAVEQFHSTLKPGLLRVTVYRLVRKERDEFVRNELVQSEPIGTIHLAFSHLR
jgi:hypothetical protein